jgi:hypothetical protein
MGNLPVGGAVGRGRGMVTGAVGRGNLAPPPGFCVPKVGLNNQEPWWVTQRLDIYCAFIYVFIISAMYWAGLLYEREIIITLIIIF